VAEDNWEAAPKDTIVSIKRLMGRGVADPEVQKIKQRARYDIVQPSTGTKDSVCVKMDGKEYSPIDISAMILQKIKEDAEFRLGEAVTHAVITVPAYFSQIQRDATRKAGLKAGLEVTKILDEPTAAAIAFGMEMQENTDPKYITVYDLGGGTFDISILMWAGNVFAPLNLQGDMWLGGDNFDQVLVDYAVGQIREEYEIDPVGNARFMVALQRAARTVKERLSSAGSADLILAGLLQDEDGDFVDVDIEITRQKFEQLIQPLLDRTIRMTETALVNAGLVDEQNKPDPSRIDYVLMAGNSTRVPLVQQAVEQMFGKERVMRTMHPKYCVAMGAAIMAARAGEGWDCQAPDPADPNRICGNWNNEGIDKCTKCGAPHKTEEDHISEDPVGLVIGGIAPFNYGAETAGDTFQLFVKKNDAYPTQAPVTQTFFTGKPNQRMISIPVYGGDHLERASTNEGQGEAFAILPPNLPANTSVRISLWLDADGIFELAASLQDGTDLRPWVLKGEADQSAVEAIQEVEQAFQEKAQLVSPEKMKSIEEGRAEAFDRLKQGDFRGAKKRAEDVHARLLEPSELEPDEEEKLRLQAENLIRFTQFIVAEYSWALGTDQAYRFNNLIAEMQQAIDSGDRKAIAEKVSEFDQATNSLPEILTVILGIRAAINNRVRSIDPARAANLLADVEKLEETFKAGDHAGANGLLNKLCVEVEKAIREADRARPSGAKCDRCGAELLGNRHCPKCGADSWVLHDKASSSSTGSGIISG